MQYLLTKISLDFSRKISLKKWFVLVLIGLGSVWIPNIAASAHTTKVVNDIAVTVHVEPEHQPSAGQETRVWFLLTRQGGAVVPLDAADCRLTVHQQPYKIGDRPLLQPKIIPINAERYQNIPGAKLTFPTPGTYALDFGCTAKQAGDFTDFSINHEAIVKGQIIKDQIATESAIASPENPTDTDPATTINPTTVTNTEEQIASTSSNLDPQSNSSAYGMGYIVGTAIVVGLGLLGLKAAKGGD